MKLTLILMVMLGLGWAASDLLPDMLERAEVVAAIPEDGLFAVKRGTLTVTLVENGTLVAKDSNQIQSGTRSSNQITWIIDEGTQVEEGDVLCRLDATEKEDQLQKSELDILQAQADLETAETNLEIQITDNSASIEKAGNAVEKAVKELERYEEGDAPKERRLLLVSISEAETNYTRAAKRHEDSQKLLKQDYITSLQAEEDEIAFSRSEVQLESARKNLELFEKYTLPMTIKERSVAVSDAEREVETSAKRSASTLRQKEVSVEQNRQRLEKLIKNKEETLEEISKMTLTAPTPGIVIYGDPRERWNRSDIKVGGSVWGRNTIITIPDLRVMQVKLRIHEADISKVKVGQSAKVTMDTWPGLVLDASVSRIASIASGDNDWEDDPEVKKFDVEVTLASGVTGVELKPGVSAKAEVFIDTKDDVVQVPLQCVFLEEGRHLAYVLGDDGRPKAVDVVPGMSNQNWTEIVSGLDVGQKVLLFNPNLAGSSQVSDGAGSGDEGGEGGGAAGAAGQGAGISTTP